ncbi:MAG TPA: GtrA family protein [Acidimicrobiales bacterium]|nr:GtrA family protein [Acidimicrobiales bacterium]
MLVVRDLVARPRVRRLIKFGAVSAVAVVISQITLLVTFGLLHWTARPANLAAFVLATIPSFELNRRWTWRRSGRTHMRREVIPFWVLAFAGLFVSDVATRFAENASEDLASRTSRTLVIMGASLATYGVLWLVKFALLDHLVWGQSGAADPEDNVI